MRLFSMYFLCKEYTECVEEMILETRQVSGNTVKVLPNWLEKSKVINKIAQVGPIREYARALYDVIPAVFQDIDRFDVSEATARKFEIAKNELLVAMKTVINTYEAVNNKTTSEKCTGFDIKLPAYNDIGEFAACLEDLDFVIKQCPFLNVKGVQIKYGSVDVGSTWLTFLVTGTMAVSILEKLSKIVDQAVKIKSHATTVKMQEEALRSMELKNELASEMIDAFKKTNKVITDKYVSELENDLGKLNDGEEVDKAGRCLEKLAFWMDKGLQIYSAIDADNEIKDLFPVQEDLSFLSDDIQKLIEMKSTE